MKQSEGFSARTLALGILTASLAVCFQQVGAERPARAVLLLGLPCAVVLAALAALFSAFAQRWRLFSGMDGRSKVVCGLFGLWFLWELFQISAQAHQICWEQFGSMAVIGLAPLLFWIGWQLDGQALDHTARILWWFVWLGALVCVAGLGSQMRWQRLLEAAASLRGQTPPMLPLYAEYFALPLLGDPQTCRKGAGLPFVGFGVQAVFALGMELLFGPMTSSSYTGYELLRAWAMGVFSRMDALLVLFWLATALYRICFLSCVLRRVCQRLLAPVGAGPEKGEAA